MWRRHLRPRVGSWRPRGRVRGSLPLSFVVVVALCALGGCSSSGESGGEAARTTTPAPDTAACPTGPARGAADLPALSLDCLTSSGTVEMSALHGRPEVINIWASWCAPCREEMPLLQRAHAEQGDRVLFLGVDVKDSRSHALAFLADHAVTYPQVFDARADLALRLRLQGVPNTLFVDRSGRVVDRVIGPLTDARLEQDLAALVND